MYRREQTNKIFVGNVQIGGNNNIVIQSMTTTKTENIVDTLNQIKDLIEEGCQIVRVAILDDKDVNALSQIVKLSKIPVVADIHFNPDYAIKAINAGAHKISLNPGNIDDKKMEEIVF